MRSGLGIVAAAGAIVLAACGGESSDDGALDMPMPSFGDSQAIAEIREQLDGDDKETWNHLVIRMSFETDPEVESETVGEAINKERAKMSCRDKATTSEAQGACFQGAF